MEKTKQVPFGTRRAEYIIIDSSAEMGSWPDSDSLLFEKLDTIYRSLCAMMYNYAPLSGHPGGSISSGRFVASLLYKTMSYDSSCPGRPEEDIISYAAGHKALGLYAHWALRNEILRIAAPHQLPKDISKQLRLEDLLGFRRNPGINTPLFKKFKSKALDGHPTPATPFLRLSTGASGVGVASSLGLAFAAADYYGSNAPVIHVVEGEGGLTPGRVAEALAAAGTASLKNVVLHVDWNQASIDSNAVCRFNGIPGDYVQWDPAELTYLNDWNTILVEDGKNFRQVFAAQEKAASIGNNQPTAIIYKTIKGWNYGIEGKKSHGAGHPLCSATFYNSLIPVLKMAGKEIELCRDQQECAVGTDNTIVEECFWDALMVIREILEKNPDITTPLAEKLVLSRKNLDAHKRKKRDKAPEVSRIYAEAKQNMKNIPASLLLAPSSSATLRGELGKVLRHYNQISQGAILTSAADLLGSTSVNTVGQDFPEGFFNAKSNPHSRTLSLGGICEDAMAGISSGISTYGNHIGVCSSYGAFIVALGHIAARLHAIGGQSKQLVSGEPLNPFFIVAAHAGIKTGEDGPTHADPQPLQLIQENFPKGMAISLTPWDPQEMWTLVSAALDKRPGVICPFVTRPNEKVYDRKELGLAPVSETASGIYLLRKPLTQNPKGVVVLQGSEVAYSFIEDALPLMNRNGDDIAVYYVSSAELFDLLPEEEKERIFPESAAQKAMGITGFTLPTMYRWIQSSYGRAHTLYPFRKGHFLGSGKAESVIAEAGLDGESIYKAIAAYLEGMAVSKTLESKTV